MNIPPEVIESIPTQSKKLPIQFCQGYRFTGMGFEAVTSGSTLHHLSYLVPFWAVTLFCHNLCSGFPFRSHSTLNSRITWGQYHKTLRFILRRVVSVAIEICIMISHFAQPLKPLDTFGTETKLKVQRFTNNLQGLQKVMVKDFS